MTPRLAAGADAAACVLAQNEAAWEQISPQRVFTVQTEREEYSTLDRVGRIVFAVEAGRGGSLESLAVEWSLTKDGKAVAEARHAIASGLLDLTLDLTKLEPGRYDVAGRLLDGQTVLAEQASFFRCIEELSPPREGRVAVVLPRGIPVDGWPVQFGIPFPKGALWNEKTVRLVKADGTPAPSGAIVRSRWGATERSSIRWLGVDFQPEAAGAWWPDRTDTRYYMEFGPQVAPAALEPALRVAECPEGFRVNTGPLQFLVRRQGFNLLDDVRLNGKAILTSTPQQGLYLVDHEGAVYRAANDPGVKLAIEEQSDLRVTLRAEGWYVKDGTTGTNLSYTLPTDKLCKFITRVEAYAGKPYVRILNTWIITYDPFTVRLKDLGFSLPLNAAAQATFGVEGAAPITQPVPKQGVYLTQHLAHDFAVEDGAGKRLADGRHCAGWVLAQSPSASIAVGHRETWQRFPKEMEVLPDALKFHVWPAHGRTHPEIDETARDQMHRLWFAHQGSELTLKTPWKYYFAAAEYYDTPATDGITAPAVAHVLAAVEAGPMGAAITSDCLVHFAAPEAADELTGVAGAFQSVPAALADPRWTCDSLAMGWQHPYDPERFAGVEDIISAGMRGYWATQDDGQIYGMWLYRPWHHSQYYGKGVWELYRLYNGTHHYEAIMPWLFYARSGDPFYLTQGLANIRELTDVQMIHYADPAYTHREYSQQRRLVGSTKHDDCIAPWGDDHAILGHLTCYNSMILAHYLTGDLRLREGIVDEWQNTLVADRGNPQYAVADRASRSTRAGAGGRDNSNAVGELIDLYQLTYDPRVLALFAPRLDAFLNRDMMRPDWGYPLHNVLQYYGSEKARQALLDGVSDYLATKGKPKNESGIWSVHAPHEVFALAGILHPSASYAADAFAVENLPYRRGWSWRLAAIEMLVLDPFPDCAIYLPRCEYALAHSAWKDAADAIGDLQSMPRGTSGFVRCIVREDEDREFSIFIVGQVAQADGFPVQVFGPDNAPITERRVAAGFQSTRIAVPADGKTGQYVIFIGAAQKDHILVPVTALPEVYCVKGYTGDNDHSRFFTRSRAEEPETLSVQPHKGPGEILSRDLKTVLAESKEGEAIAADVGPDGAWVYNKVCYIGPADGKTLTLSTSPERWFAPDKDKMELPAKD